MFSPLALPVCTSQWRFPPRRALCARAPTATCTEASKLAMAWPPPRWARVLSLASNRTAVPSESVHAKDAWGWAASTWVGAGKPKGIRHTGQLALGWEQEPSKHTWSSSPGQPAALAAVVVQDGPSAATLLHPAFEPRHTAGREPGPGGPHVTNMASCGHDKRTVRAAPRNQRVGRWADRIAHSRSDCPQVPSAHGTLPAAHCSAAARQWGGTPPSEAAAARHSRAARAQTLTPGETAQRTGRVAGHPSSLHAAAACDVFAGQVLQSAAHEPSAHRTGSPVGQRRRRRAGRPSSPGAAVQAPSSVRMSAIPGQPEGATGH